jgi:hypothetical protein
MTKADSWEAEARQQACSLLYALMGMVNHLCAIGADDDTVDKFCEPYLERLESLYADDVVFGRALDQRK